MGTWVPYSIPRAFNYTEGGSPFPLSKGRQM